MTTNDGERRYTVLENVHILDPVEGAVSGPTDIAVEEGLIVAVERSGPSRGERRIDLHGLLVMPGLVDCHVHVTACSTDPSKDAVMSPSYVAAWAARSMRDMLMRGFTTVRDIGGADFGLAEAQREGLIVGPRILFGGPTLSQTGGHGDDRGPGAYTREESLRFPAQSVICDGEPEVRRAARHLLRTGADHVKMMLSGGVVSPTDRVTSSQFSVGEIVAVVEEACAVDRYVVGHAYSAHSINRALESGVRSIEHGNRLDDSSIELFLKNEAFLGPTLATYRALSEEGDAWGLSRVYADKVGDELERGMAALERADKAGVQITFGTDLLGGMQRRQCDEFAVRGEVQSPLALVRSATTTAAKLLRLENEIGELRPGYAADMIGLGSNPLASSSVLANPAANLRFVMHAGEVVFQTD
ncbi:MAG: amidohydrolase family protein [Candidatus Dormiibacterota bacterium]